MFSEQTANDGSAGDALTMPSRERVITTITEGDSYNEEPIISEVIEILDNGDNGEHPIFRQFGQARYYDYTSWIARTRYPFKVKKRLQ